MNKSTFNKPYKTTQELLKVLEDRGLQVDNEKHLFFLQRINYYKLTSYRFPFLEYKNGDDEKYKPNINLDHIIDLYHLDILLKQYIFIFIDAIEVALRTQFAINYQTISLDEDKINMKNIHIQYHMNKYHINHDKLPTYIFIESITFGNLKNLFKTFGRNKNNKNKDILSYFGYEKYGLFVNHLNNLNSLRNIVAHSENLICRYNLMGVDKNIQYVVKQDNILFSGMKEYLNNKNNGFSILANNYIDKKSTHLNNIIKDKSSDTFYPYYVLIEHYIQILKLDVSLKDSVDSFRNLIKNTAIKLDNNNIIKVSSILGIQQNWGI